MLATKLYLPPPRPNLVRRPRLLERLNAGLHRKLTLISAPAGFGKSTLVSEWLTAPTGKHLLRPEPVGCAWLSLDEGDSDPIRFLAYLVAALQTLAPRPAPPGREGTVTKLGEGILAVLQSAQPPRDPAGRETLLTALLNEITTIPDKFVLVLDDYHMIDAAPRGFPPSGAVDQALTFLLEHLPPQMHLVITTREDPQLPLARLRARGQMTELRASDLRFTPAEAADFLNQVMDLDLSAAEVTVLETRTEGWIAGLQLAALSLQGNAHSPDFGAPRAAGTRPAARGAPLSQPGGDQEPRDVARFVRAFAGDNRYIVDYLVEEVLQRQPAHVRSFLLQTSILDRLSGGLCNAVTGQDDSPLLLDALERGNLFVIPLDAKRHWYRYHHLFADVLHARAMAEQPDQVAVWHQRASDWYEQNGLRADAIRHALAAEDFTRAAGLVELAWPAMDGSFQTAAWLGWAKAIPEEQVRARPVLRVTYAWAMLNGGELEAAETRLIEVERWLDTLADARQQASAHAMIVVDEAQFRTLPASIATARAYLAQSRGDLPDSVKYGQRALDLLPATDYLRRGPAAALLGLAQWASGDLDTAYRTLADAMAGFHKVGNLHFATSVTSGLADIRTVQGRLHDAIRCYTQALQLALAQHPEGTRPLIQGTANLYLGLSELYHEQGNREVASQHLHRAEELGDQAGLPDWRYRFCRVQARFKETQGDLTSALDWLDEAERNFRSTPVPAVRPLAALRTRIWVAQGRLREARHWVQEMNLSVDDELSFLREFEHITLARVCMAEYMRDPANRSLREALHLLDRLQQAAQAGGRLGSVIEIAVLQALAHQTEGNPALALVALERALRLAEPEGYVRIFVDEGLPLARLLRSAAARAVMPGYAEQLLVGLETEHEPTVAKPAPVPVFAALSPLVAQSLIEPLSQRELEVLQLIAQGLSNSEISEKLFLALSTVKGHNRIIFDKLQVQRRTEAVARGRQLGLV